MSGHRKGKEVWTKNRSNNPSISRERKLDWKIVHQMVVEVDNPRLEQEQLVRESDNG